LLRGCGREIVGARSQCGARFFEGLIEIGAGSFEFIFGCRSGFACQRGLLFAGTSELRLPSFF
jgi:hypothetical protein